MRKTLTESSYRNCFNLHDAKHLLSKQYFFKPMTNERTIDRIVNNTFEKIGALSKLIIVFEIFKKRKIVPAMQKRFSGFFFKVRWYAPYKRTLKIF